jgi:hypothetical protein
MVKQSEYTYTDPLERQTNYIISYGLNAVCSHILKANFSYRTIRIVIKIVIGNIGLGFLSTEILKAWLLAFWNSEGFYMVDFNTNYINSICVCNKLQYKFHKSKLIIMYYYTINIFTQSKCY